MMQDNRNKRLEALVTAMTEARAVELREAAKLVETGETHKRQGETWKAANEHYVNSKKAVEAFIEAESLRDAKELNEEYARD